MGPIKKLLKSRLALALLGVISLSVFVWILGPLFQFGSYSPLDSALVRFIIIALFFALWASFLVGRRIAAKRQNNSLMDSLADETGEAQAAEADELNSKMQSAVATLKDRDFSKTGGSKFIYELPWYLIIGPPGAGKTTLLSNSGLNFPLEESHGKFSVKGVGGTRNCDWWFTDQAVLLDTAGRYTTQDSHSESDSQGWSNFLQLLMDNRSRRPVNGILIAIALHELIKDSEDNLLQTAKTIRFRIEEIHQKFGMLPPIYVVVTKCDLLAGFSEYFSEFDETARQQVWGFTLDAKEKRNLWQRTREELKQLRETLNKQVTTKLKNESSQLKRDQIYGFPMQFAAVQKKVLGFIEQFCAESRLQETPFFRGLYFTSATQSGSPIDQVVSSVAHSFGFNSSVNEQQNASGRSYFIKNLLTDVAFAESGLAGSNLAGEKRTRNLQWLSAAAIATAVLLLGTLWGFSHYKNNQLMHKIAENSALLESELESLGPDSLDLIATANVLDRSRALVPEHADGGFTLTSTGLYQGEKIAIHADKKYQELLIDGLLARLITRLEHQMHAETENSEFLFEALKTYQMLGNRERFNSEDVIGWFSFDFDRNLPARLPEPDRQSLQAHMETLFAKAPFRLPRPLDSQLVDQYQQLAAATPLEQRAYHRLKQLHSREVNSNLKLTTLAGKDIARALILSGDESLNNFVPVFFSREVYEQHFLPASEQVAEKLKDDAWVLGQHAGDIEKIDATRLRNSVQTQYHEEYIDAWQSLLDSLKLRKSNDLVELANFISLVTDEESPLKSLIVTVSEQTTLSSKASDVDNKDTANENQNDRRNQLNQLIGNSDDQNTEPESPATLDPVTRHFSKLHDLTGNWETNASRLDTILAQMSDLNLQLLPMSESPAAAADTKLSGELAIKVRKLGLKADRLPTPMAAMVKGLANDIDDASSGGFCAQLNTVWENEVYPFYESALRNRYPLNRRASNEISLEDFGRFFAPGGVLDTYVTTYLAANVQKAPGKWKWVGSGSAVCLSDNTLVQLANADEISKAFFAGSNQQPSFSFSLNEAELKASTDITQLYLDIGGRSVEFFHGPVKGATNFQWPGDGGNTKAQLRVEPVIPGSSSRITLNSPWAVLKLLDQGKKRKVSPNRTAVSYVFGGRPLNLEFQSSSFNPLDSAALRRFSCPKSL